MTPELHRKIIHIDMDAFFAAVEQRDFPHYRNRPVIVGGSPDARGVVATCSYEARRYGVHSAMPSAHAFRLCPHAVFIKPRFEAYKAASAQIRQIFADYSNLVEPLSLDEAYLDVSDAAMLQGSASLIAKAIKEKIKQHVGLIASAGVSYNKFLAKLGSDRDKPDGFYLITPQQGPGFAEKLPISQFHGIGKVTAAKMQALGIATGKDLRQLPLLVLQQHFGKAAGHYYNICRGIDHRPVNSHRITKSVGVETTFQKDITARQDILRHLQALLDEALQRAAEKQLMAYTLTVKIKYHNFVQITRSRTLPYAVTKAAEVLEALIKDTGMGESRVRLLGITLSSLDNKQTDKRFQQTDLFRDF
jgi:DNA polymerase-4